MKNLRLLCLLAFASVAAAPFQAPYGCECTEWEDHPNTLLGDDGTGVVKTGISFDDCREACCESDQCVAFGHCVQDADGSDNAACAYKGTGRCIWYQHNSGNLRHNNGHFTGFQHGDHCKPVPDSPGGGGAGGHHIILPHFDATGGVGWGWALVISLSIIALAYFGAGAARGLGCGQPWLPHRHFWLELFGLIHDGMTFITRGTRPQDSVRGGRGADGDSSLAASNTTPLLKGDKVNIDIGLVTANMASRGSPTRLHVAAQLGDSKQLRRTLNNRGVGCEDINAGDNRRYTAFHVACAGNHVECVQELIQAGCDTTLLNEGGLAGGDLARQLKRTAVWVVLQQQQQITKPTAGPASTAANQSQQANNKKSISKTRKKTQKKPSAIRDNRNEEQASTASPEGARLML